MGHACKESAHIYHSFILAMQTSIVQDKNTTFSHSRLHLILRITKLLKLEAFRVLCIMPSLTHGKKQVEKMKKRPNSVPTNFLPNLFPCKHSRAEKGVNLPLIVAGNVLFCNKPRNFELLVTWSKESACKESTYIYLAIHTGHANI